MNNNDCFRQAIDMDNVIMVAFYTAKDICAQDELWKEISKPSTKRLVLNSKSAARFVYELAITNNDKTKFVLVREASLKKIYDINEARDIIWGNKSRIMKSFSNFDVYPSYDLLTQNIEIISYQFTAFFASYYWQLPEIYDMKALVDLNKLILVALYTAKEISAQNQINQRITDTLNKLIIGTEHEKKYIYELAMASEDRTKFTLVRELSSNKTHDMSEAKNIIEGTVKFGTTKNHRVDFRYISKEFGGFRVGWKCDTGLVIDNAEIINHQLFAFVNPHYWNFEEPLAR